MFIDIDYNIPLATEIRYEYYRSMAKFAVKKTLEERVNEIASNYGGTYVEGQANWETDTWERIGINGE